MLLCRLAASLLVFALARQGAIRTSEETTRVGQNF